MGQTAIVSPQIIDSTQIGRDLITAASQAAAQAIIGVTPFDVDADYLWGGINTFEVEATFEGGINTEAITSTANLVTTLPAGGQGQYYFGNNPIYLMTATEFRPAEAGTTVDFGAIDRRWTSVYGVDGDFSGTVTANAFVGDGSGLTGLPGGNPFDQDLNTTDSPSFVDGSFSGNLSTEVGGSYRLYNLGDSSSTDSEFLDISATSNVFTVRVGLTNAGVGRTLRVGSGNSYLQMNYNGSFQFFRGGSQYMSFGSANITVYKYMQPSSDLGTKFGSATRQWSTGYFGNIVASGNMTLSNLHTSDPAVAGQLWNDSGTIKISAG